MSTANIIRHNLEISMRYQQLIGLCASPGLDILYPFLYKMTIVAPIFRLLIDTEGPDRATVKHPPSISLANLFDTCLGGKRV